MAIVTLIRHPAKNGRKRVYLDASIVARVRGPSLRSDPAPRDDEPPPYYMKAVRPIDWDARPMVN